jgi:hypothetical protein
MTAPWRSQVSLRTQNRNSLAAFRQSYPEYTGMKPIQRGEIITLDETPRKRFNFLVNPSVISTGYEMSQALDVTNRATMGATNLAHLSDGMLRISFSLLLDRTYEVYQRTRGYEAGVLHDILALEQVGGIPSSMKTEVNVAALTALDASRGIQQSVQDTLQGVIVKKYLRFLFGTRNAFSFDGYMSSVGVTLTHFSSSMVPTRASVEISAVSFGGMDEGASGTGGAPTSATRPTGSFSNNVSDVRVGFR